MSNAGLLSVREVAELLGCRPHSIGAMIRSGQLRAIDISLVPGGRPTWRVDREELEIFIQRRTHTAAPKRRRKQKKRLCKVWF
jgi:excisionase family DNA binding protein